MAATRVKFAVTTVEPEGSNYRITAVDEDGRDGAVLLAESVREGDIVWVEYEPAGSGGGQIPV